MTSQAVPRAVRRLVRDRAGNRCEYCQHSADFACASFECEHILPRSVGGGHTPDGLAWACPACNGHKYSKTRARDPVSGRLVPLFNPRRQDWDRHFRWSEDHLMIEGRTRIGRATVAALQLNRIPVVNLRRVLRASGDHPVSRGRAGSVV